MSGRISTFWAGAAVAVICFLLASLSWLLLLVAFFLGTLGYALWRTATALHTANEQQAISERARKRFGARASSRRRQAMRRGNVYEFPARKWTDSEVSEAAE